MQTTDIVVLVGVAAFVAVLLRIASAQKSLPDAISTPDYSRDAIEAAEQSVPAVGHEIGLPFDEDDLANEVGASADRPEVINYYFKQTRLTEPPPDSSDFLDEFTITFRSPDGHQWNAEYVIATPGGLTRLLTEKQYRYVVGDGMLVVPRYDLDEILRAVTELQFAAYSDDPGGETLTDNAEHGEGRSTHT